MTEKKDIPGKGPVPGGGGGSVPKKPYATIDLAAAEIGAQDTKPHAPEKGAEPAAPQALPKPEAAAAKKPDHKPGDRAAIPAPRQSVASSAGIGRILTHVAAGVAGGFLALLAANTVGQNFGRSVPASPAQLPADLAQRFAALEGTVRERALAEDVGRKLAETGDRLAKLEGLANTVAVLGETQARLAEDAKPLAASAGELGNRVAKLEETLTALAAAGASDPQAGHLAQMAALGAKIGDLETQLAGLRDGVSREADARGADVAALKTETGRLGQRVEALKAEDDQLAHTLRGVQQEAAALRSAIDGVRSDLAQQLKSVARLQDVAGATAPLSSRLGALEQSVTGVVKSEADRQVQAARLVLALELGNLKRALDRGGAYAAELAEVKKVAGADLDLSALDEHKGQGVATLAVLSRDFRDVRNAMLDAESERRDASVLDRLVAGMKSVVRVRKVSYDADDMSTEAIVGRMEQALEKGRFAAVLDDAKHLSPKVLVPAQVWLGRLEARARIERAIAEIENQLKAALGGKAETGKGTP